jgi:hypothetical protein
MGKVALVARVAPVDASGKVGPGREDLIATADVDKGERLPVLVDRAWYEAEFAELKADLEKARRAETSSLGELARLTSKRVQSLENVAKAHAEALELVAKANEAVLDRIATSLENIASILANPKFPSEVVSIERNGFGQATRMVIGAAGEEFTRR